MYNPTKLPFEPFYNQLVAVTLKKKNLIYCSREKNVTCCGLGSSEVESLEGGINSEDGTLCF